MASQARSNVRITVNSPVVLTFVAACFVATLAGQLTGGYATQLLFASYRSSLLNPLTYLRLFTHVLGHSGWEHLISNMIYILLVGPLLEEKYGSLALVEVIAVTALVTGLINCIFFPHQMLCGASGVCFALILLSSLTSFREGEIPLAFILVAILFLGQEVVQGVLVNDNVSNLSHIVGGVTGTLALAIALGVAAPTMALAATTGTTSQEQTIEQATTRISADDAKAIALANAGYPEDQTCDMSVETFDNDETGVHKYWVSFCAPGMTQYDYHIDMHTGEILTRVITY